MAKHGESRQKPIESRRNPRHTDLKEPRSSCNCAAGISYDCGHVESRAQAERRPKAACQHWP